MTTLHTTAHLNFRGNARQALEFYQVVFGGDLSFVTYGQAGQRQGDAAADLVLWGQVSSKDGFRVMAYDVDSNMPYDAGINSYFVSIRSDSEDLIQTRWAALSAAGTVRIPLAPSAWSPLYGMLVDGFGVTWILDVAPTGWSA